MKTMDLKKILEVKINGTWYELAGINRLPCKPMVTFFLNKGRYPFGGYSYQDYPLDGVESFRPKKTAP